MIKVLTNNPQARAWWEASESENFCTIYREGSLKVILTEARDLVHAGWRLINHPLSTSIKPNQSPFKTVILVKTNTGLDYPSLRAIEESIEAIGKLGVFPGASPSALADLQFIDLEISKPIREQIREE